MFIRSGSDFSRYARVKIHLCFERTRSSYTQTKSKHAIFYLYQAPRPFLIAMARYRALAARSLHDMLCLCTCRRQRLHVGRAVAGLHREINLCCSGQWFSKFEASFIKVNEPLSVFNTITCIPGRLICERRVCKTGTNMGM